MTLSQLSPVDSTYKLSPSSAQTGTLFWPWPPENALSSPAAQMSFGAAVSTGRVQQGSRLQRSLAFRAFRLFPLVYFERHLEKIKQTPLRLTSWVYLSPLSVLLACVTVDTGRVLEVPLVTRIAP